MSKDKGERVFAAIGACTHPRLAAAPTVGTINCIDCRWSRPMTQEEFAHWNPSTVPPRIANTEPPAPAGEVTQAATHVCVKCGFCGIADDDGFHRRPKDGEMCNYTARPLASRTPETEPLECAPGYHRRSPEREIEAETVTALREAEETIRDALLDSQYLAGVKAGWNAAQADDPEQAFAALLKSREGHMAGYKEARAALNAEKPHG